MNKFGILLVSVLCMAGKLQSQAVKDTNVTFIDLNSKQGVLRGQLPKLMQQEVNTAKAEHRLAVVEIGATWCGPCVSFEASLKNTDMIVLFNGVNIIHLDVNEWDTQDEMGLLGFKGGTIPVMDGLDDNGHLIGHPINPADTTEVRKLLVLLKK